MIEGLLILAPLASIAGLAFAIYLALWVLKQDEGSSEMQAVAAAIREGARAYLKRQYLGVGIFFAVMFVILLLLVSTGYLGIFVPFAFIAGGFFSGLAGFVGMTIATSANSRTTQAVKQNVNQGLRVAFSSGAVMGLSVVGLGLLYLSISFYLLRYYYVSVQGLPLAEAMQALTSTMLNFGIGASSMALFARVGGGIYTKAADVGADLVGKVEVGIPEDDPRNPAVIADNVGDNVGDVAGMGADLYESYVGSIIATTALAVSAGLGLAGVAVPLLVAAAGIIAAIVGTFFVKSGEDASQAELLVALRRGTTLTAILVAVVSLFLVISLLGTEHIGVYLAMLVGLAAGVLTGFMTEFFTSANYYITRNVAETAKTGPATVIIGGLSAGMISTTPIAIIIAIAIMASYLLAGGSASFAMGLYGVGLAAVGMLSTLGITLATDAYGPVADNAGGIAEMTHQGENIRTRTDALDSLGNTTAATGKGFAIGSAALTALALIAAYRDHVAVTAAKLGVDLTLDLSLLNPRILVGLLIGGMLPFAFCSMTMKAVGRAAQQVVMEVRRQFREIKGLMEGKAKADYARCVVICTKSAQKEMVMPSLLAIVAPILVGILLGVEGVAGLLSGTVVTGFMLAVMMANAGGCWDNAKKYIEDGALGGKGSDAHKAAVVGDTVGDPFKDTSGPSLNILLKLVSMVAIVFASFTISVSLF